MSYPQSNYDPIWRMPDVCKQVGLSRSTIYRLVENNDFPKPIPLSSKSIGFLSSEVIEWKNLRISNSRKLEP